MSAATKAPRMGNLKIDPELHRRLKSKAAMKDEKLNPFAESILWPAVGGKPKQGKKQQEAAAK